MTTLTKNENNDFISLNEVKIISTKYAKIFVEITSEDYNNNIEFLEDFIKTSDYNGKTVYTLSIRILLDKQTEMNGTLKKTDLLKNWLYNVVLEPYTSFYQGKTNRGLLGHFIKKTAEYQYVNTKLRSFIQNNGDTN